MLSSITTTTQLQEILARAGGATTMLDFTAKWCGPCREIAPAVHALVEKHASKINGFVVDVDDASDLVTHFKVVSMPTFVFLRENRVVYVLKGADIKLLTQAFEIFVALT